MRISHDKHGKLAGERAQVPDAGESNWDSSIVAEAYGLYAEELRRFLVGILRDPHAAGDCLQATFTKAVQQGATVRPASFKAWLFQVAYREALVLKRRAGVEQRALDRLALYNPDAEAPVDNILARREAIERVREALKTLPAEQCEVVRLRMFEQLKFAEIAEQLKVPLGTVLTRMRLALVRLRAAMEGFE